MITAERYGGRAGLRVSLFAGDDVDHRGGPVVAVGLDEPVPEILPPAGAVLGRDGLQSPRVGLGPASPAVLQVRCVRGDLVRGTCPRAGGRPVPTVPSRAGRTDGVSVRRSRACAFREDRSQATGREGREGRATGSWTQHTEKWPVSASPVFPRRCPQRPVREALSRAYRGCGRRAPPGRSRDG